MKCACKDKDCHNYIGVDVSGGTIIMGGSFRSGGERLIYLDRDLACLLRDQLEEYITLMNEKESS